MFLIFRRITTGVPRLAVVTAGTGVTETSWSAQPPPAGAVTFALLPVFAPADDCWPAGFGFGCGDSRSSGAGREGPAPGWASEKDGSSSGVDVAGAGVGACEDAPVPRLPSSSSPPHDTNHSSATSRTAPSTTARRRQYTAGGRGPTVVRMMGSPYARAASPPGATRRLCDTDSLTDR